MLSFSDSQGTPQLRCNVKALQAYVYRIVGEMLATMTIQGGPLPQLLDAIAVRYMYITTGSLDIKVKVQDMAPLLRDALHQA